MADSPKRNIRYPSRKHAVRLDPSKGVPMAPGTQAGMPVRPGYPGHCRRGR